ncbi:MAG: class I SAM-dependent methyltransferase [Pirellulales bacterium]|nr:class I SAM-dependent methyltransferase [Pirellulales bacterium]
MAASRLESLVAAPPTCEPHAAPVRSSSTPRTTVACYDFWDRVFRCAGVLDYTEGFYDGDPTRPYEQAQLAQLDYLLDAVGCQAGSRILDIGCGNGELVARACARGAFATGVTISPHQVRHCRNRGLDVHLLNYHDLPAAWNGCFDAVVLNGPIEHFVQAEEAAAGRADAIYHELFGICHRVLDPSSTSRRVINTTIHFDRFASDPTDAMRSPWSYRWFSDKFHYSLLVRGFGGHYPHLGQFERCAQPYFQLAAERDATYDYHLTSEEWLRHGMRSLFSPSQWGRLLPFALRHPLHSTTMMFLLLVSQSWNWQFRGERPPMKHLWQTWAYQPT